MALPTLGANLIQSLQGTVNAIWIARLLGERALGASYNVNLIVYLMSSAIFGFGIAATVLVGQSLGRNDLSEARRAMGAVVGSFMILGALLAVLIAVFMPELLQVLQTPMSVRGLAADYLSMRLPGVPAAFVTLLLMMGVRGAGNAAMPLAVAFAQVAGDAALNPVFILGMGPLPPMGIAGSGVASTISTYAGLTGAIVLIYVTKSPLRLRGPELRYLVPRPALVRFFLVKGLPICVQTLLTVAVSFVMAGLVNREGALTTAAFTVAAQVWTYIQIPALAMGTAISAMASQSIGAGHWDRVNGIVRLGVICSAAVTAILVLLSIALGRSLAGVFLAASSPSLSEATHIIAVTGWGFVAMSAALALTSAMRANGAVMVPLAINAISLYPARLGFAFALRPVIGVEALWWSFPLSLVVLLLLTATYYKTLSWRRATLMPLQAP